MFPDECSVTEVTLQLLCTRVDQHMGGNMRLLCERPLTNCTFVVLLTCVNLQVHSKVAWITKGLTAVFTLMRFHPHVPHKVHIEFSSGYKCPGAHVAHELLFSLSLALSFRRSITCDVIAVVLSAVPIIIGRLHCIVRVARPRRGR